jgi:hypothetical protein
MLQKEDIRRDALGRIVRITMNALPGYTRPADRR